MKLIWVVFAIVFVANMGTAIAVIYSKHQSRKLFVELQKLHKQTDDLDIEWGQLQLEQSAWSSHGRIEKIARKKLKMTLPRADEVLYIQQ